jgi:4-hydroxy-3-methylbut-2-enyl diphosphate reductase
MKITIAKNSGFCFGVKRALDEVRKLRKRDDIYVLGKLIHNPQVLRELEEGGIKSVESIDKIKEGNTIIISAHGVPDNLIEKLKGKGFEVVDSTCPLVKKVHALAKEAEKDGCRVIIFGDKEHTEVKGISGNLKNPIIISDIAEARNLDKGKKYCLVSQTTQNIEKFNQLVRELKKAIPDLRVHDTICIPTKQRQQSSVELAKNSDVMIVIGGKISANTKKLVQRCAEFTETHHIETEKELKREWFESKENIGVTAGASTPDYVIRNVVERIEKWALKAR